MFEIPTCCPLSQPEALGRVSSATDTLWVNDSLQLDSAFIQNMERASTNWQTVDQIKWGGGGGAKSPVSPRTAAGGSDPSSFSARPENPPEKT